MRASEIIANLGAQGANYIPQNATGNPVADYGTYIGQAFLKQETNGGVRYVVDIVGADPEIPGT